MKEKKEHNVTNVKKRVKLDRKRIIEVITYCISLYENNKINLYEDYLTRSTQKDLEWNTDTISSLYMELDDQEIYRDDFVVQSINGHSYLVDSNIHHSSELTENQAKKLVKPLIKKYPFVIDIINNMYALSRFDENSLTEYLRSDSLFFMMREYVANKQLVLK